MLLKRVIPNILFSGDGLYKTRKFKNKAYVGDVVNAIRLFNDLKVDELVLLDIEASKKKSGPNFDLVKEISSECFMPLCYGGGVSSVKQAEEIFSLGVEKVCINSSAMTDPGLITNLAKVFGSQSVVVGVDIMKSVFGPHKLYSHIGARAPKKVFTQYLKDAESAGAGEIFLTSVDREGSMKGFDLTLVECAVNALDIPVIVNGGGGCFDHIVEAFEKGASAVSCGSKFIYQGPHRAVLINYLTEEEHQIINPM